MNVDSFDCHLRILVISKIVFYFLRKIKCEANYNFINNDIKTYIKTKKLMPLYFKPYNINCIIM